MGLSGVCPGAEPGEADRAVATAADWLATHQVEDGGWNFDHRIAPGCDGKCSNHGALKESRNSATALAILGLLSAGHGEMGAKYEKQVKDGLAFLTSQLKEKASPAGKTYTLEEPGGSMYAHGLATLALCEGLRTRDDGDLRGSAQRALSHIAYAQDPTGGGWRYAPRQAGDTSVTGWQVTALCSARGVMLEVPESSFTKANEFLDSVQKNEGAMYGYTGPGFGPATTAIGLALRRKLGWKPDRPSFKKGVEFLAATGPSKANLYYNYYATQALRQADDASWTAWRETMNSLLLETQAKEGHEAGSWFVAGEHGSAVGGRLYCTSLATMILSAERGKLAIFKK
jgi:hypothetical protein